ncbi:hypothetical protein C1I98_07630 [Spongiactinospora gelatinilytica]|uniref:Uncharacterized protein n=1 Tax=Spongiactinospora gelatinilytica TaxID=2666298 RepID=A0A2W2HK62_9ACTN|nr:hypothetical protein [Spongiactinospora gelatinilytica]PZG52085.1 hypothetical protein C1I98_07630 [Spongiactinospora gelatinilytica]
MMGSDRSQCWPAYVVALMLLGYAAGKAVFALQARLGFPGGPPVSAAETDSYFLDPALAQWFATASGVLGACIALATVTARGRRVPRTLMWLMLTVLLLAVLGGKGITILDGFIGIGVGWQWNHGVVGLVAVAPAAEMFRSNVVRTRRVAH